MARNEAAPFNANRTDCGQSLPGAFPSETSCGIASNTAQQKKTPAVGSQGKHLDGNDSWFKRLDMLEAQPVKHVNPLQSQQTRHMKLSQSQLENMDSIDILDAMERGEW